MRKTLIISDNRRVLDFLIDFVREKNLFAKVFLARSPKSPPTVTGMSEVFCVNLKKEAREVASQYELLISAHCKQIFPAEVHTRIECINVHPGFNPETRGWFPQVWAILSGLKTGVTVHRIDAELDNGEIIDRIHVPVYAWDTSGTAYERVIQAELNWLRCNLLEILNGNYRSAPMESKGNLFLKKDFDKLCEIDMRSQTTFQEAIDRLRALSFDGYKNAYFIDEGTGAKIYLSLSLEPETQ